MRGPRFSKVILLKVLAFTLVSAVFTGALATKIGNLRLFSHSYAMHAVFADASGVFKGDAVKLAGVDVGRVGGARIVNGRAVVDFTVDDSVKLPPDSIAAIRWRNVLGQRFLYLYPGTGTGSLAPGATIPLAQTEDAGDIGEFLNQLGPILRAIDPQKANAFLDAMNQALAGNEASVRTLVDDGAVLAGRLGQMDQQIQTLLSSSDTVISTYASQDRQIGTIIDDLDQLGGRLDQMTGDINSVVVNFADVQSQMNKLLTQNRSNIDLTLSNLSSVLTTLAKDKDALNTTLCSLPAGVSGYFQTTSWGEWFNVRIVEAVLKDRNSQTVGSASEPPGSRPPHAPPPNACGVHNPDKGKPGPPPNPAGTRGVTPPGSGSRSGGSGSGFNDFNSFLQFVLGGKANG